LSVLSVALLVAGCGGSELRASGNPGSDPDGGTRSAAPAMAPEGAAAREVTYRCASGRSATIVVDVPDPADLADILNRIQPCEYDRGFDRGTVPLSCESGPLVVQLRGSGGQFVQTSPGTLCP
jgi:hypothetical protein